MKHKNVAEKHLKHLKQIKPYFCFTYMSGYIQVKVLNMANVMHFLTGDRNCCQLWQLLKAVVSFDSCYMLLPSLAALQAVAIFDSSFKLTPALTAIISCGHLDSW